MDSWLVFVVGLFLGGTLGALAMACCCVAGRADRGRSIAPQREPTDEEDRQQMETDMPEMFKEDPSAQREWER